MYLYLFLLLLCVCSVDAMSVMNVIETDNVEVLQLMNASTTADNNISIDQVDASLISVLPTTVLKIGRIFSRHCVYVCFVIAIYSLMYRTEMQIGNRHCSYCAVMC